MAAAAASATRPSRPSCARRPLAAICTKTQVSSCHLPSTHHLRPRRHAAPRGAERAPSPQPVGTIAPARLLDPLRERIRYLHYSIRTEDAYVHWVRGYVRFHGLRHPRSMGPDEVRAYLSWLAVEQRVSVSTHRQAQSALVFLYRQLLGQDLP